MSGASEVIDELLRTVPGSIRYTGGDWHVEKGSRAVTVDDIDSSRVGLGLLEDDGGGVWSFVGGPFTGSPDVVLSEARAFLT